MFTIFDSKSFRFTGLILLRVVVTFRSTTREEIRWSSTVRQFGSTETRTENVVYCIKEKRKNG